MSTVTVTPLVAGDTARSADVNATLTSWNTGTAAGQIGADNVRVEGVDRRTMSAAEHVVGSAAPGNNTIVTIPITGPARSTGVWAAVPLLTTVDSTYNGTTDVIVHAHVDIRSAAQAGGVVPPEALAVSLRLEVSSNSGASWSPVNGSVQTFQMRETGNLCSTAASPKRPGLKAPATWSVYAGQPTGTRRYRVAYQTAFDGSTAGGVDPDFWAGTIFVEALGA